MLKRIDGGDSVAAQGRAKAGTWLLMENYVLFTTAQLVGGNKEIPIGF
jgi:hypothetical protein